MREIEAAQVVREEQALRQGEAVSFSGAKHTRGGDSAPHEPRPSATLLSPVNRASFAGTAYTRFYCFHIPPNARAASPTSHVFPPLRLFLFFLKKILTALLWR